MNPRVVVAPDSFKGSLTAQEASAAMAAGVREVWQGAIVDLCPLADGGEGTLSALESQFQLRELEVTSPLTGTTTAMWGWDPESRTALIEAAQAIGLGLTPAAQRDVWRSQSRGVGQLMRAALDAGAARIYLAVGGSGTNDAGAGMLAELGVRFLDKNGNRLEPVPAELGEVDRVDASELNSNLAFTEVILLADVDNPLTGPTGATYVYGPQKGAQDLAALDAVLSRLSNAAQKDGTVTSTKPGAGAAGGLGWAAMHFLNADSRSGAETVARLAGLPEALARADLLLTGEGAADSQTLRGKTVTAALREACHARVPGVVIAGQVRAGAERLFELGALATLPLSYSYGSTEEDMREAAARLRSTTADICRLLDARIGPEED